MCIASLAFQVLSAGAAVRGYRYAGRLSTTATALISASMGRLCASVLSVKTHLSCVSCTVMWLCGNFCFNHYVVEIEI